MASKNQGLYAILEEIMEKYEKERKKSFKSNQFLKVFKSDFEKCIFNSLGQINRKNYQIKGSAGEGRWAYVPWLGIFDKDITKSAQSGFYIVYLFSTNTKKVYLSLNQGWTLYKNNYNSKERIKNIKKVTQYFQNRLGLVDSNLVKDISLIDSNDGKDYHLAKGYEYGNIFAFEYKKGKIPSEKNLIDDLQKMLLLYAELKGNLLEVSNPRKNINYILDSNSNSSSKINVKEEHDFVYQVQENLDKVKIKESKGVLVSKKIKNTSKRKSKKKTDFFEKSINDKKIGDLGEKIIFSSIQNYLKEKFGISDSAIHVSEIDDSAGYDIKLKDKEGKSIYIEVKTTSGPKSTPFYVSENELETSEKYKERYLIVRLYNVNKNSNFEFEYYVIKGPLKECPKINISPTNYQVELI